MRVGVTGHRALVDVDGLAEAVDTALDRIAVKRVIRVRSSLAEGADRLVTERVLARPGGTLVAVLPLAADEYAEDFTSAASRGEFRRLLAVAEAVEVTGPDTGGTRDSAYERAGRAVVDGSDVLLALWDGDVAQGRGGTAEIVAYAREEGVRVEVVPVKRAAP